MAGLNDREKAFEDKFAHDAELMFKATARRNRLFGEWAAGLLGIEGADAVKAYAAEVIKADLEEAGDEDVLRKVMDDFADKGVEMSDHRVRKQLDQLMQSAKEQIASGS